MAIIASVVIDGALSQFDRQYSYVVPEHLSDFCTCGKRVVVPFGNKVIEGIVIGLKEQSVYPPEKIKNNLSYIISKEKLYEKHFSCNELAEWSY